MGGGKVSPSNNGNPTGKGDKYEEKIDRYLSELIADRHELEAEVLRRGEKISHLQKALVDLQLNCFEERERFLNVTAENERLKKNEEKLHENIRHLLNATKDKELRDRIIYILQDPKVEIGVRYNSKSGGSSTSGLSIKKSHDEFLKEQIKILQSKLDEHSKVSQNKSDVILEDCKIVLEKSVEKLLQNEKEISALKNKLLEAESGLFKVKLADSELSENRQRTTTLKEFSNVNKNISNPGIIKNINKIDKSVENIRSNGTNLHLNLIFLSKILTKSLSLLRSIQSTQVFTEAAKLTKCKGNAKKYVEEDDVAQLKNCVRQCTRLSFDISNLWKTLSTAFTSRESSVRDLDVAQECKGLEWAVEELAVATAEADLLCISLSRATFFDFLTGPNQPFEKFGVKEANNHSKYVSDVVKMESHLISANTFVNQAAKFAERIIGKCESTTSHDIQNLTDSVSSKSLEHLNKVDKVQESKNLHSSRNNLYSNERKSDFKGLFNFEPNKLKTRELSSDHASADNLIRRINKVLAKIKHLENGEYFKDNEFCQHLADQLNSLNTKLKELYNEFNVKDLQEQFSEYSSLTLHKLEALAKQSRDTVVSAEAQIVAHRDNARLLSQKLRDTEELLRESIHECLSLKQKLQLEQLRRETDKAQFSRDLQEKLYQISDFDDLETAVKEVASSIDSKRESKKASGPFECMYCKQGSDHKLCIEKIREVRANNRKLATELKLLQKELKEEKKLSKLCQEQAEKATCETANQKENLKETLQSLERKNASLLEQLKLERNRLKNMERYRRLEIEGFQTDIKNLKTKIQEMEKQLTKAVLIYEQDKKDIELLQTIRTTAQNSKQATGAIRHLKAKLYELENDIKHL